MNHWPLWNRAAHLVTTRLRQCFVGTSKTAWRTLIPDWERREQAGEEPGVCHSPLEMLLLLLVISGANLLSFAPLGQCLQKARTQSQVDRGPDQFRWSTLHLANGRGVVNCSCWVKCHKLILDFYLSCESRLTPSMSFFILHILVLMAVYRQELDLGFWRSTKKNVQPWNQSTKVLFDA